MYSNLLLVFEKKIKEQFYMKEKLMAVKRLKVSIIQ